MFLVSYIALWCLTAVLFIAVMLMYRHVGQQLQSAADRRAQQGPAVDEQLEVTLETLGGGTVAIGPQAAGPQLVAFTAPGCGTCNRIQPILRDVIATGKSNGRQVVVVHRADAERTRSYLRKMPSAVAVVADPEGALSKLWGVQATPYFVATDKAGIVRRKGVAITGEQIGEFFFDA